MCDWGRLAAFVQVTLDFTVAAYQMKVGMFGLRKPLFLCWNPTRNYGSFVSPVFPIMPQCKQVPSSI